MSTVPKLNIFTSPDKKGYVLVGFENVDIHGRHNSMVWNALSRNCDDLKMSEVDKLKVISTGLLRQNEELREKLILFTQDGAPNANQ